MPEWRTEIRARLQPLRLSPERESEIVEEVAQHLDDRFAELRAMGRSETDAAAEAWRELEAADALGREVSRVERPQPMDLPPPGAVARGHIFRSLVTDVRFALRSLRKNPGFSVPVLLAMALSIGPTTAIVSVSNWLVWRPLPAVQRPNELGVAWFGRWFKEGGVAPVGVSYQNIADLKSAATTMTGFAGVQEQGATLSIGEQLPEVADTGIVTADFFQVLRIPIRTGRDFLPQDDLPPFGSPVAIVGEGLAKTAFGSAAAAIGQRFTLNRQPFEVVGVAPEGFAGITRLGEVKLWITAASLPYLLGVKNPASYIQREEGALEMFVIRKADGRRWSDVETELTNLTTGLAAAYPKDNEQFLAGPDREAVVPRVFAGLGERPLTRGRSQRTVTLLLAVGGVLVLLGCANVANLMVFRASKREREVAVRKALGASSARLVQLLLTESWLLAIGGAALGIFLAIVLKSVLQDLLFPGLAGQSIHVPFDRRVMGGTLIVATVTGLLAGMVPAWIAARSRLSPGLAGSGNRNAFRTPRLRSGLAVVQLALSLTLLIGAALLVTTVRNLHAIDLGFTPDRVTTVDISLSSQGYNDAAARTFWGQVQSAAEATGQFEAVAVGSATPFGSKFIARVLPPGAPPDAVINVANAAVSANYFQTLAMTFVRGRAFTADEAAAVPSADPMPVILSETMARRLFGSIDVLGRTVRFARTRSRPERDLPIIGVVRDARDSLTGETDPLVYVPLARFDYGVSREIVMVRSARSAAEITASMRQLVAQLDKNLPVESGVPLQSQINRRMASQRLFAWTLSVLGGLGFVLAALGVYGLVAQATAERTREFGIRMAIGADRTHIARLVFRFAASIAAMGTVVGVVLAYFGSRTVSSMLFGITALDPRVYLAAISALAIVVLAACAIPVVRAMRVQPVDVLRAD